MSPNKLVAMCQNSNAGISPSKVAEVFQTDNAGMSPNKVVGVSPSKVARPSPDSLVEMSLNNNVDRSQGSLVVKFHDRFVMLFLASRVGMSQGPVAEMSRSKSVARSVRTSSGAKSAARE